MIESLLIYSIAIVVFFSLANQRTGGYYLACHQLIVEKNPPFITKNTILILILFTLFCGLRYDVGADYLEYLFAYQAFNQSGDLISGENEIAFTFLIAFCNKLHLNPPFFFGLVAFLQMLFFLLSIRRERFIWPWVILFFFVDDGFLLWMNGLRQSLALCVWLFSLYFIEEKKPIYYFAFCILATLFHSSAILLFILYPLLRNGTPFFSKPMIQYLIIVAAFIIRLSFSNVLIRLVAFFAGSSGLYENYLEVLKEFNGYGNTYLAYWFRLIIYCIIVYYSGKMRLFYNSKRFNIIYTLFFVGVISRCVIPFEMAILARIFMYFTFFEPIMLAYFVFYLYKNPGLYNSAVRLMIIISFVSIFFLNQIVSDKNASVWYKFYYNQPRIVSIY